MDSLNSIAAALTLGFIATACAPTGGQSNSSPEPSASPTVAPTAARASAQSTWVPVIKAVHFSPEPARIAPATVAPGALAAVAPVATTSPTSSPSPTPAASPTATPTAAPTRTPTPQVIMASPDAAPIIVWYSLSSTVVHSGDTITGVVITSSNVASVEARIAGFGLSLAKTGVGHFRLSYTVPDVPWFYRRTYPLDITARNTRGDRVTQTTSITIQ